jgi:hypothetical protein
MLLAKIFQFVMVVSKKYNIDESHGLSHSMNVLHFANRIYESELIKHPTLKQYEKIIYVSAVLHDMCDKKYMDEVTGLQEIGEFLEDMMTPDEIDIIKQIISTMSYSTVKKNGFPTVMPTKHSLLAYHIVREADLLAAYDFDRCMIYTMYNRSVNSFDRCPSVTEFSKSAVSGNFSERKDLADAFSDALALFKNRVLKHSEDGLFVTDFSKHHYIKLHIGAVVRIEDWKRIMERTEKIK